jgi:hypothetical protein
MGMEGSVARLEKWLQREVGDEKLRLRWDSKIERYTVGRWVDSLSAIDWFYVCTDGNSGYRPIDRRTVRKILTLDTWRHEKQMTAKDFVKKAQERQLDERQERAEAMKYRVKHEARYIKKAAQQDGLIA